MLTRSFRSVLLLVGVSGLVSCGSNEDPPARPGSVGGSGVLAGAGGSSVQAGAGGSNAEAGTGGSNAQAGSGGTSPQAGKGGTSAQAGTGGSAQAGAGGSNAQAGSGTGGSSGAAPVSYETDVKPLFEGCVTCHYTGSLVIDIEAPFTPVTGLVDSDNTWAVAHPEGNTPAKNVAPGDPDHSFLLRKISDPDLDPATAGEKMPWQVPRLTDAEILAFRDWITAGALNDDRFTTTIRPIIGTEGKLSGKCIHCHRAGGQKPNLTDPFDAETGAVGIDAERSDLMVIEPGDPDASFLIVKVSSETLPPAQGAPMPAHFPRFTSDEAAVVRTWIAEGAKDN
jgi:hypothetical protein